MREQFSQDTKKALRSLERLGNAEPALTLAQVATDILKNAIADMPDWDKASKLRIIKAGYIP